MTLQLAEDAETLAERNERDCRLYDAKKLRELSKRLQLAAATCLDALGDDVTHLLATHENGEEAMHIAIYMSMRTFCSRGELPFA